MAMVEKSRSGIISAAIFIALEVAALNMLSASSTLQNIWLNRASHRTMALLWGSGETVRNYFSLGKQNEILSRENMELSQELAAYKKAAEQSGFDLTQVANARDFRYIPASIVKMSRNTQRNYIILDRGSEDGVKPEDGIITASGVIGIIQAVDKHYSYGLTLMNMGVKVSARIGKDGPIGPLSWNGLSTDGALLKELPLHYEVSKGDTILTSGYSTIFPADIPLGTAESSKLVNGSTREVEVRLFQDLSALRYVTIVQKIAGEEIASLEKKEGTDNEKQ